MWGERGEKMVDATVILLYKWSERETPNPPRNNPNHHPASLWFVYMHAKCKEEIKLLSHLVLEQKDVSILGERVHIRS